MSTEIEYCDNANCRYNKKSACTHAGPIDVDESGSCISAAYEEDSDLPPKPDASFDIDSPFDESDEDVWFKKI